MSAYEKRLVKWDWAEGDGWIFAKHGNYTICPSREFEGHSELWSKDVLISKRTDVDLLKNDADKHERKQLC